jgi:DNA mismatch repair protein MutS
MLLMKNKSNGKLKSRTPLNLPPLSLMFPGVKPAATKAPAAWESDLALTDIVKALTLDRRYGSFVRQMLLALTTDGEIIAWRQATMADFLNNPMLVEQAGELMSRLAGLQQGTLLLGQRQRNLLLETSDRLAELDAYVAVVQELYDALGGATLKSPALLRLRENLLTILNDPDYQALRSELPELRAPLEKITSLTIGVNLDYDLKPISAVLMAINNYTIGEPLSFLERLIGVGSADEETGIAPLRTLPNHRDERALNPLFQDLDKLMTQTAQPVARALNRYVRINSESLVGLEQELGFFVAAAKLFQRLPFYCLPEIAPVDERVTEIDDLASLYLLLQGDAPITSDAHFDDEGRIAILTGPNSGGKTTYVRAIGIAQALFQCGLPIPARHAHMSPVDAILTHFPALETGHGRLAEEAVRLRTLFEKASSRSLVLLNETFSSTAPGEAVYLAHDVLCGLRAIGVRAIYATHLIELALRIDEIERKVEGTSQLFCLTAAVQQNEQGQTVRTFRIERGMPHGRSYAEEIARLHGISLEQILAARPQPKEAGDRA